MKKLIGSLVVVGTLFFSGCGSTEITLNQVMKKGMIINKGMTKAQVQKTLQKEPDSVQKVGDYELWTYEGIVTNPNDETDSRYKNLTIKFKDGIVDYTGYFACKLPKTGE